MIDKFIKSPLNYTGNKYRILPQITKYFPKKVNTFVDLFCGGATVGFNIDANKIILIDSNPRIINLLKTLLSQIENDFQWLKILSLGNILNYEKFTKNIFLEQAIIESKDFLINQIKKLELVNDR